MHIDIKTIIDLVHSTRPIIMNESDRHSITVKGTGEFLRVSESF